MSKKFAAHFNQSSWIMFRIQEIWNCKKKNDSIKYFNSWSEKRIEKTQKQKTEFHTNHQQIKNHQSSNYHIRNQNDNKCEKKEKKNNDDDECDLEKIIKLSRFLQ